MKMVANETELRNALKERAPEITIVTSYADTVKKKYGLEYAQNNRLFRMSPLHHHYQKGGFHESKIVNRMIIIGVMLAIVCLITLKMR